MANVKNFGLVGVGENVQFGKAGPTLSKQSSNVLRADGSAAFMLPLGDNSARPTASTGMIRTNNQSTPVIEYYNGTTWVTLATGGAAVTSVNGTAGRVTSSNTGAGSTNIDIDAAYVGQASITTLGTVTTGTWNGSVVGPTYGGTGVNNGSSTLTLGGSLSTVGAFTSSFTMTGNTAVTFPVSGTLLSTDTIADNAVTSISFGSTGLTPNTATDGVVTVAGTLVSANGGTGLSTFAANSVLYASSANTWAAALPGATSGVQAWDADLDAIAALAGTGFAVRTAADTWAERSITGTSGRITVTNGDGVVTSPSIDLATVTNPGTGGSFVKITTDAYGRVTDSSAVVAADITALVDATYVNVSGDSMASAANLTFVGGGEVLGLPSTPSGNTAATSKAYVDSLVAGLSWKQSVGAATTPAGGNMPGFSAGVITIPNNNATYFPNAGAAAVVDGATFVLNARVLVKNQTNTNENGIYVVTAVGVEGTTDAVLTRSSDMDAPADFANATVFVNNGTVNDNTGWTQTADVVTVNTSPVIWAQFSGSGSYLAGSGLDLSGNTFSVNVGAGITILPTDEVGIDVEAGKAVQLTGSLSASQLTFVLDGGAASGLEQSAAGLKISANGVTNAMILNDFVTIDADSGTADNLALGGTFLFVGDAAQGISSTVTAGQVQYTVQDATTGLKGVASFDTANFVVTAGAVSIKAGGIDLTSEVTGVLPVANGGTNVSSLVAEQVLFGGAGGTAVAQDADFAFAPATNTLTLGTSTYAAPAAGDLTITATATNADINLIPNGTGSVIIGPSGAGLIQSDTGNTLTVSGDTGLTLRADTSGDITLDLAASNAYKVSVVGPTDAQYIDGLANNDLVTKYYVDTVAGNSTGDVKAVQASVDLSVGTAQNIGAALPAGATILSVKVNVTAAAATGSLQVGKAGGAQYMTDTEVDTQSTGLYLAETMVTEAGSEQVQATVTGTPAAGTAIVVVTYKLA